MTDINNVVLWFAAIYLIIIGLVTTISGSPSWLKFALWILAKIMPIATGITIAFNLYARFMGWPV